MKLYRARKTARLAAQAKDTKPEANKATAKKATKKAATKKS